MHTVTSFGDNSMKSAIKNILSLFPALALLLCIFVGYENQSNGDVLKMIKCPLCQKVARIIIHGVKNNLGSIDAGIAKRECPKIARYMDENDCSILISSVINDAVNSYNFSPKKACRAVHYC